MSAGDAVGASTDEVFRDPGTDRMMRVRVDAAEERHYEPDGRH